MTYTDLQMQQERSSKQQKSSVIAETSKRKKPGRQGAESSSPCITGGVVDRGKAKVTAVMDEKSKDTSGSEEESVAEGQHHRNAFVDVEGGSDIQAQQEKVGQPSDEDSEPSDPRPTKRAKRRVTETHKAESSSLTRVVNRGKPEAEGGLEKDRQEGSRIRHNGSTLDFTRNPDAVVDEEGSSSESSDKDADFSAPRRTKETKRRVSERPRAKGGSPCTAKDRGKRKARGVRDDAKKSSGQQHQPRQKVNAPDSEATSIADGDQQQQNRRTPVGVEGGGDSQQEKVGQTNDDDLDSSDPRPTKRAKRRVSEQHNAESSTPSLKGGVVDRPKPKVRDEQDNPKGKRGRSKQKKSSQGKGQTKQQNSQDMSGCEDGTAVDDIEGRPSQKQKRQQQRGKQQLQQEKTICVDSDGGTVGERRKVDHTPNAGADVSDTGCAKAVRTAIRNQPSPDDVSDASDPGGANAVTPTNTRRLKASGASDSHQQSGKGSRSKTVPAVSVAPPSNAGAALPLGHSEGVSRPKAQHHPSEAAHPGHTAEHVAANGGTGAMDRAEDQRFAADQQRSKAPSVSLPCSPAAHRDSLSEDCLPDVLCSGPQGTLAASALDPTANNGLPGARQLERESDVVSSGAASDEAGEPAAASNTAVKPDAASHNSACDGVPDLLRLGADSDVTQCPAAPDSRDVFSPTDFFFGDLAVGGKDRGAGISSAGVGSGGDVERGGAEDARQVDDPAMQLLFEEMSKDVDDRNSGIAMGDVGFEFLVEEMSKDFLDQDDADGGSAAKNSEFQPVPEVTGPATRSAGVAAVAGGGDSLGTNDKDQASAYATGSGAINVDLDNDAEKMNDADLESWLRGWKSPEAPCASGNEVDGGNAASDGELQFLLDELNKPLTE